MAKKFTVSTDGYQGVTIDCSKQSFGSDAEFIDSLKDAILEWKEAGKRGLWVKIPRDHSSFVPLLSQLGLDFHHAQPGYVMMTFWMCDDLPNHLPEYANQYIGVGGFVVNTNNQLLVIKEQYHARKNMNVWKLPGGHADKGEDLADTACREVFEETGIRCEFISLVAFRHQHNYRFGCSDIYFICLMRPLSLDIKTCPVEIADCRWMDIDDFINDASVSDANRHFAQCYKEGLKHAEFSIAPAEVLSYDKKKHNKVYSIAHQPGPHQPHEPTEPSH